MAEAKAVKVQNRIKACLTTCAVSSTRATFLAGYTYYQTGRYNFAVGSDPSYLWFFRISFELSVLAAFTAEFVAYYIHRCPDDTSKLEFLKKAVAFPRLVFQMFLFALILYSLGLSRIGYVYYPTGCPAAVIPNVIFIIVPVLLITVAIHIMYHHYQVEQMTPVQVKDALAIYKVQAPLFLIGEFEDIAARVRKQSDILAGRAVYVAGMAQAGLWSYRMHTMASGAEWPDNNLTVILGKLFLASASFALAFGLVAAMSLSCATVFIQDLEDDDYKIVLTYRLLHVIRGSYFAYFASFFSVALCVIFMPWGCQYIPYSHINVPPASIATVICMLGLYWCVQANTHAKNTHAKEIAKQLVAAPPTPEENKLNIEHDVEEERFVSGTINQYNNFGAQGTLASGFVFYNVVTYYTDILKLSYVVGFTLEVSVFFLFFNVTAICAGLTCAVLDSLLTGFTGQFGNNREKFLFLQYTKGIGRVIEICFYISMGSWYMLFALCGYCKFTSGTSLPAIFSAISVLLSFIGSTYMDSAFSWVNIGRWDSSAVDSLSAVDKEKLKSRASLFSTSAYNVLFLGGFAYNCIIFFNFQLDEPAKSYKVLEHIYVGMASACFGLSITIITLSSAYDVFTTNCSTASRAYDFAIQAAPVFKASLVAAAMVVFLLISCFSLLGYVKYRPYYPNWEPMVPVMLWSSVGTFMIILGFTYLVRSHVADIRESSRKIKNEAKANYAAATARASAGATTSSLPITFSTTTAAEEGEEPHHPTMSLRFSESEIPTASGEIQSKSSESRNSSLKHTPFIEKYSKALEQMSVLSGTSSFVAGNVCYEILFSEAKKTGPELWQSYWYFLCNNLTFSFGVCTVSLTTLMTISIWEMDTVAEKHILADKLHKLKDIIFVMSFSSLFFWMAGTILGDGVKYTGEHLRGGDYKSSGTIVGVLCCCFAVYIGVTVKQYANEAIKEAKNASTPIDYVRSGKNIGSQNDDFGFKNPLHSNNGVDNVYNNNDSL